tara:strand:- start:2464 stop:3765 length:1302 start_codon:yes stop_codon:yes gene_type:complete
LDVGGLFVQNTVAKWFVDIKHLRNTSYPIYWLGGTLGHLGFRIFAITSLWQAVQMSEKAAWVALVGFLYGIPLLPCSPFAGWLGDKKMSRGILLVTACIAGAFVAGIYGWIVSKQYESQFYLGAANLFVGMSFAFYGASRLALLSTILHGHNVFSVASLDLSSTRMMGFVGPVAAGLLLTYYDYTVALSVAALTLLGSALAFIMLNFSFHKRNHNILHNENNGKNSYISASDVSSEVSESVLSYLKGDRIVLLLLFMGLMAIPIGMTYLKMTPVFVDKVLQGGPALYGNLIGVASAFAAISGLFVSFATNVSKPTEKCVVAVVSFGLSLVVFAYTRIFWMLYLIAGLTGLFQGVFLTIMNATYQSRVPDLFRGRIIGSYGMVWGLLPVATIGAGYLTDKFSVVWVINMSGWFCVLVGIVSIVWLRIDRRHITI